MKTDFNFENAKVGDKVYHVIWGWTEITEKHRNILETDFGVFFYDGKKYNDDLNPAIYPYNPFEQNQERFVEVLDSGQGWIKRELIKITTENKVICWNKYKDQVFLWSNWREIPQKELTQEEKINLLWEKYGKEL